MNLLDLIDRFMRTTPPTPATCDPPLDDPEMDDVVTELRRVQRDLAQLDAAVAIAEARLRARGWIDPEQQYERNGTA
jgi:hypothetical protein